MRKQVIVLEDTIADVVGKLREGAFPNEQSVSQHVVLRILSDLHWDVFEPSVVWPEYVTASGGRADFALCEPRSKPKVLIEVKQPGKAEGGVRQSLEYAFHTGVPFVVLTDGQTWSFYLPAEPGDYEDRRVFKLDLYEHSVTRSADVLESYLGWRRVASGEALEDARSEYRSQTRRALARQAIPDAWTRLVGQRDELLIEVVGDAVESKEGVRPDAEDVARFLAGLGGATTAQSAALGPARSDPVKPKAIRGATTGVAAVDSGNVAVRPQGVVVVLGEEFRYRSAKERLTIVLRELANRDATILNRCYENSTFRGRRLRYLSRKTEELNKYAKTEALPGGWLLDTNFKIDQLDTMMRAAIEVAGLKFGTDIKV